MTPPGGVLLESNKTVIFRINNIYIYIYIYIWKLMISEENVNMAKSAAPRGVKGELIEANDMEAMV